MKYEIIFLDLDGTLMDSGEGIMKCAQYALRKLGVEVDDWQALRFFVGPPLEDSFKEFYGFDDKKARDAVLAYRERYFTVGMLEQKPYDGVEAFLGELKDMGLTLCLATSKMQKQSRFALERFGLSQYIDINNHVFARDEEGLRHTKGDVIRYGMQVLGVKDRSKALMIGDRKFDIIGANECGLDSVGVLYGYGERTELEEAGATYVCSSFEDVLNIIR